MDILQCKLLVETFRGPSGWMLSQFVAIDWHRSRGLLRQTDNWWGRPTGHSSNFDPIDLCSCEASSNRLNYAAGDTSEWWICKEWEWNFAFVVKRRQCLVLKADDAPHSWLSVECDSGPSSYFPCFCLYWCWQCYSLSIQSLIKN